MMKRTSAEQRAAKREIAAAYDEADLEDRTRWKAGMVASVSTGNNTLLRIEADHIETSQGFRIPVSVCSLVWGYVRTARTTNNDLTDLDPIKLGAWSLQVVRSNGDIVVECSTIPFAEMAYIANLLNLEPIA